MNGASGAVLEYVAGKGRGNFKGEGQILGVAVEDGVGDEGDWESHQSLTSQSGHDQVGSRDRELELGRSWKGDQNQNGPTKGGAARLSVPLFRHVLPAARLNRRVPISYILPDSLNDGAH